jgi:quinohemoprotein ethanol dehydrogenase
MRSPMTRLTAGVAMLLAMIAHASAADAPLPVSAVDEAAIAAQPAGDWLSNGRTYGEERYAPLDQIDQKTVSRIGLAWEADLESPRFGIEATPIVVDGVLYVTSSWGRVFAFDAKTGKRLWAYDPQVPGEWLRNGCCKPMNRGVAVWKGKIFVGAFDGRLIALDAATGRKVWETNTTNGDRFYTITGAPRVVKGKVIIGNGGADFGVRGFFSA